MRAKNYVLIRTTNCCSGFHSADIVTPSFRIISFLSTNQTHSALPTAKQSSAQLPAAAQSRKSGGPQARKWRPVNLIWCASQPNFCPFNEFACCPTNSFSLENGILLFWRMAGACCSHGYICVQFPRMESIEQWRIHSTALWLSCTQLMGFAGILYISKEKLMNK